MAWMSPSMPALKSEQIWLALHATFTFYLLTKRMHLPISRRRIPPIPIGQVSGHLSSPIRQDKTNTQIAAQMGKEFLIQWANLAKVSLNSWLTTPYHRSQSAIVTVSIPPGPVAPDSFRAIFSTTVAVTFTFMNA
eukprot:5861363-Ditylum_brightwellii.AAC.1